MAQVQYDNDTMGKCTVIPDNYTQFTNTTTITITASSGYHFTKESSPYLSWVGNDDGTRNSNMVAGWFNRTLSPDGKTITLVPTVTLSVKKNLICKQDSNYPIEVEAPSYPTITITKNLTNVIMTPNVSSIELDGSSKVITLSINQGYQFDGIPYFEWNRETYNFEKSGNSYIYDLNTLINENASITIYATAIATAKTKNVTNSLSNCSVTPPFNSMVENETYILTLNADNGYKFVSTPILEINNRDKLVLDFTKVTDYQYTLSFTAESSYFNTDENAVLSGVAVEETPIIRKYGTIQVYKPTPANMSDLSTKRFQANGTVDGVTYNDIDLGQYITQFKRVFVDVVTNSTGDIYLGRHNTQINAPIVNDDVVTVDCGNVTLTGANGNELDTKIYKIFLVLTCYGITPLDSVYMNKTINIKYQCNIVTGYADIIISQVVENVLIPIQKLRCKISQDLPYIINVEQLKNNVDDDVYNEPPKIILQKQNVFAGNGYDTYKQNTINNETGYFIIDRFVNHSINAPENELNEIESLLKSGVTI